MRQKMKGDRELSKETTSQRSGRLFGALHILLCLVPLCFVSLGWAQLDSTALTGTVCDSSGHRLPGVGVTAVQNTTGLRRNAISSTDGAYYFPKLPVGTYTVTFHHQEFQSVRFEQVTAEAGGNSDPQRRAEDIGTHAECGSGGQSTIARSN